MPRTLVAKLLDEFRERAKDEERGLVRRGQANLTSREWEVLDLLCAERSTEEIAEEFVLSEETVRSHVKNVMRKLGVRSRREAVAVAMRLRQGLPPDQPDAQEGKLEARGAQ